MSAGKTEANFRLSRLQFNLLLMRGIILNKKINKFSMLVLLVLMVVVNGCAHHVNYNPNYISSELSHISETIDGKALIYTEIKQDEKVYSQVPSSFTGSATTLYVKIGEILKNISVEVFSKKFKEGAYHSNNLENTEDYSIIIRPEIFYFDYRYNQLKNLGFAITPETKISLFVFLYDKQKKLISQKRYESDYLSSGTYLISFSPWERINQSIHQTIYKMLNEISFDVESSLLKLGHN
jgi:hypothetical protein